MSQLENPSYIPNGWFWVVVFTLFLAAGYVEHVHHDSGGFQLILFASTIVACSAFWQISVLRKYVIHLSEKVTSLSMDAKICGLDEYAKFTRDWDRLCGLEEFRKHGPEGRRLKGHLLSLDEAIENLEGEIGRLKREIQGLQESRGV